MFLNRTEAKFFIISGLPPLHLTPAAPQPLRWYLGQYAYQLDQALRRWILPQRNVAYISLEWASNPEDMATDGFHHGEKQYKQWAHLIADKIASFEPQ
jgi:lysophospholipase L1-like esterase